jgi:hypothetical protein
MPHGSTLERLCALKGLVLEEAVAKALSQLCARPCGNSAGRLEIKGPDLVVEVEDLEVCFRGRSTVQNVPGAFVFEVKGLGRKGGRVPHCRQLLDWVDRVKHVHVDPRKAQKFTKGILLVNAYCDRPIECRKRAFRSSVIDFAQRHGLVLMTWESLLATRRLVAQRSLVPLDFWWSVAHTAGVYRVPAEAEMWQACAMPMTALFGHYFGMKRGTVTLGLKWPHASVGS